MQHMKIKLRKSVVYKKSVYLDLSYCPFVCSKMFSIVYYWVNSIPLIKKIKSQGFDTSTSVNHFSEEFSKGGLL